MRADPRQGGPHNQPAVHLQHAVRDLQTFHEGEVEVPHTLPREQHELFNGACGS